MLRINASIVISPGEIELTAMRAQGAGGQNVNKVSSAIHLRFDIPNSSLSDFCKSRLLALGDPRFALDLMHWRRDGRLSLDTALFNRLTGKSE